MCKPEMLYGLGNVHGLHWVEVHRLAFVNGAKAAMARTRVAAEHERGGLVRPALEDIRALRFLADGVQIQSADQVQHRILIARIAKLYLQPIWFLQTLALLTIQEILDQDTFFYHRSN